MISDSDRAIAIKLIEEAVASGARLAKACEELGIHVRTYKRWKGLIAATGSLEDLRKTAERPAPANKLSPEERQRVLDTVNSEKYKDKPPCEIVPALADEGIYLASESTFYRILRQEKMVTHRGLTAAPHHHPLTTHVATAINQVWMWDITYLNGPIKGQFFYLYLFCDLFSRKIVGWEVYAEESQEHASYEIERICRRRGIKRENVLVLHSDNGSPMKGATMLATLYRLGITPSNSRPRVSNDNPYSESLFKTLKYQLHSKMPSGFKDIEAAREWVASIVGWYDNEHHHSGIKYLTPAQVYEGKGPEILAKRHKLYEEAKAKHPERWNGRDTRDWTLPEKVYLNPDKEASEANIRKENARKGKKAKAGSQSASSSQRHEEGQAQQTV